MEDALYAAGIAGSLGVAAGAAWAWRKRIAAHKGRYDPNFLTDRWAEVQASQRATRAAETVASRAATAAGARRPLGQVIGGPRQGPARRSYARVYGYGSERGAGLRARARGGGTAGISARAAAKIGAGLDPTLRMGVKLGANLKGIASSAHGMGMGFARWDLGLGHGGQPGLWSDLRGLRTGGISKGHLLMKGLGPAMLGYSMYQGYKEGGLGGAAMGGAGHLAFSYGFGAVLGGLKGAFGISGAGVMAVGAAGAMVAAPVYAAYKAMDIGNERMKYARKLELATPHLDLFGGAATMRQRSIAAMNRSALNGRYLLGSEASIFHTG